MNINSGYSFSTGNPVKNYNQSSNINLKSDTISFCKKPDKTMPVPCGADYSMCADSKTPKKKPLIEWVKDAKDGKDISKYREALISSRIKIAIKDAKAFTDSNPQYEYDDICQDLILFIVECTDKELSGEISYSAIIPYIKKRDAYLKNLLKPEIETVNFDKECEDKLKAEEEENYFKELEQKELQQEIGKVLTTIKPRTASVISMHYGLNGKEGKSYDKTAKEFKLSKERISQIIRKGIKRLSHPHRKRSLEIYY